MHSIMDPTVGTCAGSIVELTDVLTMDIHIPTEDILLPTEDIPPASENILHKNMDIHSKHVYRLDDRPGERADGRVHSTEH